MKKDSISLIIILASVVIIGIIIAIGFTISNVKEAQNESTSSILYLSDKTGDLSESESSSAPDSFPPIITSAESTQNITTDVSTFETLSDETSPEASTSSIYSYPDASGSIAKTIDEKGYFILRLDWKATERTPSSATLQISAILRVTSISVGNRTAILTVGGKDYSIDCTSAEAAYEKGVRHEIIISTAEIPVALTNGEAEIPVKFVYNFKGTFSKVSYPSITVDGIALIK